MQNQHLNNCSPETIIATHTVANEDDLICQAYAKIIADIKQLLTAFPPQYQSYTEADEAAGDCYLDDVFYNPVIYVNLVECYGIVQIQYAVNHSLKTYIPKNSVAELVRVIYHHTAKANTSLDIESCVHLITYQPHYEQLAISNTPEG